MTAPHADTDPEELEAPPSADALYYYRADEVVPERPVQTGDVFHTVSIPGLTDGGGLAIVLNHPCSMRSNGVDLIERLQLARVKPYQEVHLNAWGRHHLRVMPLPDPRADNEHYAVDFAEFGLVPTSSLDLEQRVACLDPLGINLLQQRFIFNVSRFIVPTKKLHRSCAVAFQEVDLLEEWNDLWIKSGRDPADAGQAFHDWIRDDAGSGRTRQDRLSQEQERPPIRRALRAHLKGTA